MRVIDQTATRVGRFAPSEDAGSVPTTDITWLTPHVYSVAIVDDQPIARAGMERLIGDHPQFDVVASVTSIDEFDTMSLDGGCDVVILAVSSSAGGDADTITRLAKSAHPLVSSTWDRQTTTLAQALRAGARGFVTRRSEHQEMVTALRIVATGGLYVCASLVERLQSELGSGARADGAGLAPREIETVRWIALGFTQSQIATRMGLSQATVNTYAKRIRSKLQVRNKAELTRMAIRLGYLAEERRSFES